MPYRVVFTNGEKRELYVSADNVVYDKSSAPLVKLLKGARVVAYIPVDNILYIEKTEAADHD